MVVYKDDCVYSFDSTESPGGIDVCLTCHYATSPDPAHNFTRAHYELTGHSVYLNIRKTPKLRDRPKQIKLSIDSETDADLYETHTLLKDLSGTPVDEQKYAGAVSEILNAESYSKAQEIQAWELQIMPCEHVIALKQEPLSEQTGARSLEKCSQCELTTGLWLCLSCGTVSCGRAQFGGGGGNGHALSHYDAKAHPLAVKLGSITPQGSADVFCYKDDEEVRDPEIAAHLSHWGIDIATRSKTEKSMTELQLEQNAKWDFATENDDGSKLEPVNGKGFTGMRNLGNTCYMNSVVQTLMAVPVFRDQFPANTVEDVATIRDPPNDLITQLRKVQDGLMSGRYAVTDPHSEGGYQRGIVPAMFKYLVGKNHPEFSTMRQQDAYEYLSHFLSKLSESSKASGQEDITQKLFGFDTQHRYECQTCHHVRYKTEHDESLSVPVPIIEDPTHESGYKPYTFDELMRLYTGAEDVEMRCTFCKETRTVESTASLESAPSVFVLNAPRFRIVNWVPQKIDVPLDVPSEITLDAYMSRPTRRDEKLMPEKDSDEDKFMPNETHMAALISMGFSEPDAAQALQIVDNAGVDPAMDFLFLGPEERQSRIDAVIANKPSAQASPVDPESLGMLMSMGFSEKQAQVALRKNPNPEMAIDWLFSGNADAAEAAVEDEPEAGTEEPKMQTTVPWGSKERPAKFRLRGVISHKGTSVHTGHYVAFIRQDDGSWYLYNDEKVVKSVDASEMQRYAYLYVFERA